MNRNFLVKSMVVAMLAFLVNMGVGDVRDLVATRMETAATVVREVQATGVGQQTVIGPLLVVPYKRTERIRSVDAKTGAERLDFSYFHGTEVFLPQSLDVQAQVTTEFRYRGIYPALLYTARNKLTGSFTVPAAYGLPDDATITYTFGQPQLVIGLGDTRGVRGAPKLLWAGKSVELLGGSGSSGLLSAIHAKVAAPAGDVAFALDLDLQGGERLAFAPVGKHTRVQMQSPWPHPSFDGQFLPDAKDITHAGFAATWQTSHLASGVEKRVHAHLKNVNEPVNALGVRFVEPVNLYVQTDRATKYGFLFVAFTFAAFALFELLRRMQIHPLQYLLVGTSLAMFFLLLVALAEHIEFWAAYAISAAACVSLLAFYVRHVLRSNRLGAGFAGLIGALYGALFVLLQSEDHALLLGALLCFGLLGLVMALTRKVDWYAVTAATAARVVPDEGGEGAGV